MNPIYDFIGAFERSEVSGWIDRRRPANMDRAEVMQWRKAERQRLIGERLAINGDVRRRCADQIAASLEKVIGDRRGLIVSA
jgi:hypothetical protein